MYIKANYPFYLIIKSWLLVCISDVLILSWMTCFFVSMHHRYTDNLLLSCPCMKGHLKAIFWPHPLPVRHLSPNQPRQPTIVGKRKNRFRDWLHFQMSTPSSLLWLFSRCMLLSIEMERKSDFWCDKNITFIFNQTGGLVVPLPCCCHDSHLEPSGSWISVGTNIFSSKPVLFWLKSLVFCA